MSAFSRLALPAAVLLLATACAPAAPPPGGPWLRCPPLPSKLTGRTSVANVSRPTRTDGIVEMGSQAVAGQAFAEFELAHGAPPPPTLRLERRRGGRTTEFTARRLPAMSTNPAQPDGDRRGWQRYRVDLEGVSDVAGTWSVELPEGSAGGAASTLRFFVQRDQSERPNLLWIVLDTVRADVLGCYGHDRPTSPAIDALAARAVVFDRAISQASWTLPSVATLLTSLHTLSHGVLHTDNRLGSHFATFPEALSAAGYSTAAVVSGTFTDSYWGFDQGFDHYDDLGMVVDDGATGVDPTDIGAMQALSHRRITSPAVTDGALAWLDAHPDRRFALWTHYFDPHEDFVQHAGHSPNFPARPAPRPSAGRPDPHPDKTAALRAAYEGEVAFTDEHIGRLLQGIKERGLLDSTLIVLTADHGEEFFDRYFQGHGNSLFNELIRVPLLIAGPGIVPQRVQQEVGLVDLAPTILELCGVEVPASYQGHSFVPLLRQQEHAPHPVISSLFPSLAREPGRREGQLASRIDWQGQALIHDSRIPGFFLYSWSDDPFQLRSEASLLPQQVRELQASYDAERQRLLRLQPVPESVELSPEIRATLEELGYVEER